tara:strand:- start:189 stop:1193 length:1005 start_codon:yes stop_codon:yes gene_type:complete
MNNWKKLNQGIKNSDRIVLSTHMNPDGDGLGSAVAMHSYISNLGVDCRIIQISNFPDQYSFLNDRNIIETYDLTIHDSWLAKVDLALIFDIGAYNRLGPLGDRLFSNKTKVINIDHHPKLNDERFYEHYINIEAAATGEMVYDFLQENQINMNEVIAKGIYTAVMTDTGSFRHNNTNQKSHKIAMDCLAYDIDNSKIYQSIYENKSVAQISLLAKVIDNLRFDLDGKVASFIISKNMINDSGITPDEVDGFTDFVRSINRVEVAIMVCENELEKCRINFRSKGKYTINNIAKKFGGGGHKFAAGATVEGKTDIVLQKILDKTFFEIDQQNKAQI